MFSSTPRPVTRFSNSAQTRVEDQLVTEAPMEIRLDGTALAVLMRTPGHDADLVLGFAITEGIALRPDEIAAVEPVPEITDDSRWNLVTADGVTIDPSRFQRNVYTSSSCGVCGKASIDAVRVAAPRPPDGPQVTPETLLALPDQMRAAQPTFETTGGLHAAAAFTADGTLVDLREDIGRHNAVDKLVGSLARRHWPLPQLILMVSGRVSFEMVQKAAVAGIPVVCGVSAASSLAVDLGDELGLTVIGFLRPDGFNVYCGDDRVTRPGVMSP